MTVYQRIIFGIALVMCINFAENLLDKGFSASWGWLIAAFVFVIWDWHLALKNEKDESNI